MMKAHSRLYNLSPLNQQEECEMNVTIKASKQGSIGTKYIETRRYEIKTRNFDLAVSEAIRRAYNDGLEHVLVTEVDGQKTYRRNAYMERGE
jgi:hypothetical protein